MTERHGGGKSMDCVYCGAQNAEQARTCGACGRSLTTVRGSDRSVQTKTSAVAIAAFVFGLLSIIGGLTGIPAILLGIVALIIIETSGGRITGVAFAVTGIVFPLVVFFLIFSVLWSGSRHPKTAFRMRCGTNLSGIGKAMLIYANDHDDELPRAGGRYVTWGDTTWNAETRDQAYNDNGTTSGASISSCFYLLVKYGYLTPEHFVCPGDRKASEFQLSKEGHPPGFDLTDAWDFGATPDRHCSYSYHMPFSDCALAISSEPGLAVASDRNPWLSSPGTDAKTAAEFGQFIPDTDKFDGDNETAVIGNATTHEGEGQNVLFLDSHVDFARRSFCGLQDDNIFTRSTYENTGDPKGELPIPSPHLSPANAKDSLLLHDVRVTTTGRLGGR